MFSFIKASSPGQAYAASKSVTWEISVNDRGNLSTKQVHEAKHMNEGNENVDSPRIKVKQNIFPLVYLVLPSSQQRLKRSHDKIYD